MVVSAVVGATLLLGWVTAFRSGLLDWAINETDLGEFVLLLMVGLPMALLTSVLLAGPVLWLMRVRPVWPIVLLGPVVLAMAHAFRLPEEFKDIADEWTVQAFLAGASYALAGLVTAPTIFRKKS